MKYYLAHRMRLDLGELQAQNEVCEAAWLARWLVEIKGGIRVIPILVITVHWIVKVVAERS